MEAFMPPLKKISTKDKDLEKYGQAAINGGATHVKQIDPSAVVTAPWVRLKCQFGCPSYGKGYGCPPDTPTWEETRTILDSYQRAILFHIEVPHMPKKERHYRKYFDMLVDLEGEMFKDGFYKALLFLAGPCRLCKTCAKVEDKPCKFLGKTRPCMESCGMDVFQTARNSGYFIQPLSEKTETNNEYCLMLVD
jgi:predicted metal-binding protein